MAAPLPLTTQALSVELEQAGFAQPPEIARQLCIYLDWLLRWNNVMNLVGVRSWQEGVRTLLVDSLVLAPFLDSLPLPAEPCCWDPGAGAGLPGIPLRTIWQRGSYWMIEPREKRALFLSNVLAQLPLTATQVFRGRLEQFAASPHGHPRADLIVSRAFMPWRELLPTVAPCLAPGGLVVLLLNESPEDETLATPINGIHWCPVARQTYSLAPTTPVGTQAGHRTPRTLLAVCQKSTG